VSVEIVPRPGGPALPALIAGQGTCAGPRQTYSPCHRKCRLIPCPPDQIGTLPKYSPSACVPPLAAQQRSGSGTVSLPSAVAALTGSERIMPTRCLGLFRTLP